MVLLRRTVKADQEDQAHVESGRLVRCTLDRRQLGAAASLVPKAGAPQNFPKSQDETPLTCAADSNKPATAHLIIQMSGARLDHFVEYCSKIPFRMRSLFGQANPNGRILTGNTFLVDEY